MKNFSRALKDALRHWKALLLATLCSLVVAVLWGGNIGGLFPIMKVTLGGQSLQQWIGGEIESSQQKIGEYESEIGRLKGELAAARGAGRQVLRRHLGRIESDLEAERASLISSRRLQPLINRFLPGDPFQTVVVIIGVLMLSTLIKHVFLLGNTLLVAHVSNHIARNTRLRVFEKAMTMDRAGYAKYGTSGFSAQITATTDMLCNGVMNLFGGAIREPMKILACLIGACFISWRLLVLSLLIAPVVVLLIVWLSRRLKFVCRRMLELATSFQHVMLEALGTIQTVQAYGMEKKEQRRFESATWDMLKLSMKTIFYNGLTRPITELLGIGMVGTTVIIGSYLVLYQETHLLGVQITDRPLSIATMLVFFGLLIGASDPVRKLSAVFSGINSGIVAADMLYPLLDREPLITSPANPLPVAHPHGMLELRDVSFAYADDDYVLRKIDLQIPFGSKLALVGANGSGKSSLIHLICRFYDPQEGQILLDNVDLRDMDLGDLRSRIGLVTQQTELFNESILYNMRYGSLNATDEQVIAAARMAHAHDFIETFPDGYETTVGQHGQRLSGGQRQRIALARAILRDPEVLILDEATSQIDVESERLINDVLTTYSRDRTLIVITHRLSNLCLAERVFELDQGLITPYDERHRDVA